MSIQWTWNCWPPFFFFLNREKRMVVGWSEGGKFGFRSWVGILLSISASWAYYYYYYWLNFYFLFFPFLILKEDHLYTHTWINHLTGDFYVMNLINRENCLLRFENRNGRFLYLPPSLISRGGRERKREGGRTWKQMTTVIYIFFLFEV